MIKLRGKTKLLNDICKAVEIYNARQTVTDFVAMVGNDVDNAVLHIEPSGNTHISVYLERSDYKLYLYTGERTPWLAALLGATLEPGTTPAISCYGQTIELENEFINNVNFVGCTFKDMKHVSFQECRFEQCSWANGTMISGCTFLDCTFVYNNFNTVVFQSSVMTECLFCDSHFEAFFQSSSKWIKNRLVDSEVKFQ